MELGEDLNHLNAPRKIILKFSNSPPPPSKWSQYPYDLVRFHNCPNIMKCDQLPHLRFFLSQIHPPPPGITHIRTVNFNKLKHFSKCNSKYNKYIVHCYYDNVAGKKINP